LVAVSGGCLRGRAEALPLVPVEMVVGHG